MIKNTKSAKGFTLIELMVSNTIMLIVLGMVIGMFLLNKEKLDYQSEKSTAMAQISFTTSTLSKALRAKVSDPWSHVETLEPANSSLSTTQFTFLSYDPLNSAVDPYTVLREISYDSTTKTISYAKVFNGKTSILANNITEFKIFEDSTTPRAGFVNIPPALPNKTLKLPDGTDSVVHSYTILIEVSIKVKPNNIPNVNKDVHGNNVIGAERRIWKYFQLYPENGNIF